MPCSCGADHTHDDVYPCVCKVASCSCLGYVEAGLAPSDIDKYFKGFETIIDKMQWILLNVKFFRNFNNQEIIFAWWQYVNGWNPRLGVLTNDIYYKLDNAESITRAFRYWKEQDFDKYGPTTLSLLEQQSFRQLAIEEFVIANK